MQLLVKFLRRAAVAVVLLGVLFGTAYLGGWPWFIFVAALSIIALDEYYSALKTKDIRPDKHLGWLCAIMILVVAQLGEDVRELAGPQDVAAAYGGIGALATAHVLQITLFVLLFCVAGTLVSQFKLRGEGSAVINSATTVFGVVYVGVLFSFLLRMRYLDIPGLAGVETASDFARRLGALIFVIGSIWMCDTSAYLAGNLVGRRKLAPLVSPNKTIEGSVAGFLAAIIGALVFGLWLGLPARHCFLLGAMMGVLGQVGDLGKSVLKRDIGIKDFSSLFGPHGGVLDRFDAVLVCMPLVYWYFWFFWLSRG
jgi:phosphatidate cytidylyltransferase